LVEFQGRNAAEWSKIMKNQTEQVRELFGIQVLGDYLDYMGIFESRAAAQAVIANLHAPDDEMFTPEENAENADIPYEIVSVKW
jgi:hypothetical protein